MPLKDQVANLELSQQLKKLGYPQESLFYWHYSYNPTAKKVNEPYVLFNPYEKGDEINISAPTVAELGEKLPDYVSDTSKITGEKESAKVWYSSDKITEQINNYYGVSVYKKHTCQFGGKTFSSENEADARAKMLIYLLENKLIEL